MAVTINLNAVCYAPPSPTEPKLVEKNQTVINRQLKLNKNNPLAIDSEPDNIIKIVAGKSNAELEAERVEKERIENERIATEQSRRAERQTQPARPTTKSGTRRQTVKYGYSGFRNLGDPGIYRYRGQCSCIIYANAKSGIRTSGNANQVRANSRIPRIGAIALTNESYFGHAAIVIGITDTTVIVSEFNYIPCNITEGRQILKSRVRGYVY